MGHEEPRAMKNHEILSAKGARSALAMMVHGLCNAVNKEVPWVIVFVWGSMGQWVPWIMTNHEGLSAIGAESALGHDDPLGMKCHRPQSAVGQKLQGAMDGRVKFEELVRKIRVNPYLPACIYYSYRGNMW
jgi:hypothetical protein